MARRIPKEPDAPANEPAAPGDAGLDGDGDAGILKLTSLHRLDEGRPAASIDGRLYHFANPIALGVLERHRLAALFERLGQIGAGQGIENEEQAAEYLDTLIQIGTIALPGVDGEALRALGDVQLDAVAGAFFVDAAASLPAGRLARLLGVEARPSGNGSSRDFNASTAPRRRRSG